MENLLSAPDYFWIRLIFERGVAVLYFVAFTSALNQFPALLGEKGLLPVKDFLRQVGFKDAPSLFHWKYSDHLLKIVCWVGMGTSAGITLGFLSTAPILVHLLCWLLLYFLYLSIVNVGQDFYGFGWETMLLEVGFFTAFMGPAWVTPGWIPIIILRWMLFRTEMGAGLIKLRGDPCWRNLTCLYYHHETQPLPNPWSRYFHHMPKWGHRSGVVFSHFVQLIVPFGLFFPQPIAQVCGALIIAHQLILVISGNYSWLNWLTIVLGLLAFQDPGESGASAPIPQWFLLLQVGAGFLTLYLSYRPLLNLFSPKQRMNFCWNRWHLVGAYGAFGSVTRDRYEINLEGTTDERLSEETRWEEYTFKGKPVKLDRLPALVAPYHLRLDWMIWFLPFTVGVSGEQIYVRGHEMWFLRLMQKLLRNEPLILKLLKDNPFTGAPPTFVRARFYRYNFTSSAEYKSSNNLWKRKYLGDFLPPVSLQSFKGH
ncbi:MAG TPA: lipase maturation factor family protein [Bacteriovoracaceae bacterium]|nr:lipase maturation factor family protein [Bacteriovoracaceae bacterium]